MCGILGGYSKVLLNKKQIKKALNLISERGPDSHNIKYFESDHFVLAHNRLKIIDINNRSNQPFVSQCGRYTLIFNGEIYNYQELKKELPEYNFLTTSDTEVLLAMLISYGEEALHKLNGMFAFSFYDHDKKELLFARDPFGIKPLYYTYSDTYFYFASEIPPLLSLTSHRKPNLRKIKTYLEMSLYNFDKETFFDNIYSLEPGSLMRVSLSDFNSLEIKKWYFLEKLVKPLSKISYDECYSLVDITLNNAIKRHLISDVESGLIISGGIDSSLLSYYATKEKCNIRTYTQEYELYSEKSWVEKLSNKLPLSPTYIKVKYQDIMKNIIDVTRYEAEPYGGIPVIGYKGIYEATQQDNIKVLLDGNGIDEAFLGYKKYHLAYLADLKGTATYKKQIQEYSSFWNEDIVKIENYIDNYPNLYVQAIDGTKNTSSVTMHPELLKYDSYSIEFQDVFHDHVRNYAFNDLFSFKIPRGLRFNDRISMMHSRELRVPFLDREIVELGYSLPVKFLINSKGTKSILRDIVANNVSCEVAYAQKRSIQTPQREWLAEEMAPLIEYILNLKSFQEREWVDVNKARKAYEEYKLGSMENSFFLWQWINLELWAIIHLDCAEDKIEFDF